ncbi:uncharacterized protein LOC117333187 [Pecten maximus]|uniref:uncharacterized protein LOC117333187 n=1 Tax=Pecten maximus TaxID=6579 RepID=UPI001457E649|nr:uncharacterized protein LOC117333187 [Pecten maximus]
MDGVTWTTAMSQDGSPKLFAGNVDPHTPVTSYVTPNITALHVRINPQSWYLHIFVRFDVGGCQIRKLNDKQSRFARKSVKLNEEMINSNVVMPAKIMTSMKDCSMACRHHKSCMAFTYQATDGIQWCTGYNAWNVVPAKISIQEAVFVSQEILDAYGYKEEQGMTMSYNVLEVRATRADATATCAAQGTRLIMVDTTSKLTRLQNYIDGKRVLKNNYGMFVSGNYNSGIWLYDSEGTEIDSALWSPANPDPSQGHCVMLTLTGLASVDCGQKQLAICGY